MIPSSALLISLPAQRHFDKETMTVAVTQLIYHECLCSHTIKNSRCRRVRLHHAYILLSTIPKPKPARSTYPRLEPRVRKYLLPPSRQSRAGWDKVTFVADSFKASIKSDSWPGARSGDLLYAVHYPFVIILHPADLNSKLQLVASGNLALGKFSEETEAADRPYT